MKFVCDRCSTQYQIADEKVGGRGVKVRCKRCGNTIIVRPQIEQEESVIVTDRGGEPLQPGMAGGGDEVGRAFDDLLQGQFGLDGGEPEDSEDEARATEIFRMEDLQRMHQEESSDERLDEAFHSPDPAASAPDEWYVAIADEQVGPMSIQEVQDRWSAGEIDSSMLAWHSGMSEWRVIQEIPELAPFLSSGQPAAGYRESTDVDAPPASEPPEEEGLERDLSAPSQPADEWAPSRRSDLASLVEEEMSYSQPPEKEEESRAPDPLESPGLGGEPEDLPPWEREGELPSGEVARPSDSLFDSTLDSSESSSNYFDVGYSRSGSGLAAPAYLGGEEKRSNKGMLYAIVGLAAVVVIGGGIGGYALLARPEPRPEPGPVLDPGKGEPRGDRPGDHATGVPDKKPAEGNGKTGVGERGSADAGEQGGAGKDSTGKDGADEKPGEKKGDDGRSDEIVVKRPDEKPDRPAVDPEKKRKKRRRKVVADRNPGTGSRNPPPDDPRPKPPPPKEEALPEGLTKTQIVNTMRKYQKAMKGCVIQQKQRDPSISGTMAISFTVQTSGKVSSVRVLTSEHQKSYVAGCISFIIKSMVFPKFSGKPFTVPRFPLKLGG
ncbi:MAG: zinc-ribbon domain-containing protein [Deltaproteobacteria bacterium]|nr:zinc-ribbon domain-containing protein [Deltaproteobacteria bacterium]